MDFGNALLLTGLVFAVVEAIKEVAKRQDAKGVGLPSWLIPIVSVGVGIGSTFLLGATVWAHEQVIGNHALDNLNGASKVVVGLMLGLGGVLTDKLLWTGRNIGQNQP